VASASSLTLDAWRMFFGGISKGTDKGTYWHSGYQDTGYQQYPYKGDSGLYQGGGTGYFWSTNVEVAGSIGGEWVQIQLPYKLQLTTYTLYPRQNLAWNYRYPTKFYVVGSNDGTTWYQIDYQTLSSAPTNTTGPITYTINTLSRCMYFRLITNAVNPWGNVIHYGEWTLTGNVSTS